MIHRFYANQGSKDGFLVTLQLKEKPNSKEIERLPTNEIPFDTRVKLATVRNWKRQEIEIDLCAKHAEAISSALGYAIIAALSQAGGFLLHAALLESQQQAYIIAGVSGAGKSTLAKNARRMKCKHDDKCAVRFYKGKWIAYGLPMLNNFSEVGSPCSCPVKKLVLIEKGQPIFQRQIRGATVFAQLAPQVIVGQHASRKRVIQSILNYCNDMPIYELRFGKFDDVSDILLS